MENIGRKVKKKQLETGKETGHFEDQEVIDTLPKIKEDKLFGLPNMADFTFIKNARDRTCKRKLFEELFRYLIKEDRAK